MKYEQGRVVIPSEPRIATELRRLAVSYRLESRRIEDAAMRDVAQSDEVRAARIVAASVFAGFADAADEWVQRFTDLDAAMQSLIYAHTDRPPAPTLSAPPSSGMMTKGG